MEDFYEFLSYTYSMKKNQLLTCLLFIFSFLFNEGCTDPQDLIAPTHFTRVPPVLHLQGALGFVPSGKRQILLTWEYDTLNANIRTWDVTRSINDTASGAFVPLEIVRKSASGYPFYSDTSGVIQSQNISTDSLDIFYKVIPNGMDNFVGQPSDVVHIIVRRF